MYVDFSVKLGSPEADKCQTTWVSSQVSSGLFKTCDQLLTGQANPGQLYCTLPKISSYDVSLMLLIPATYNIIRTIEAFIIGPMFANPSIFYPLMLTGFN